MPCPGNRCRAFFLSNRLTYVAICGLIVPGGKPSHYQCYHKSAPGCCRTANGGFFFAWAAGGFQQLCLGVQVAIPGVLADDGSQFCQCQIHQPCHAACTGLVQGRFLPVHLVFCAAGIVSVDAFHRLAGKSVAAYVTYSSVFSTTGYFPLTRVPRMRPRFQSSRACCNSGVLIRTCRVVYPCCLIFTPVVRIIFLPFR